LIDSLAMQNESTEIDFNALSDEQLVAKVVSGDNVSYQALVTRFYTKIWRLSVSILKDEQEAEDAVQEIFLALWQNVKNWDPNGTAKFSTWIYRVSFNKCIDIKRKKKPDTHGDEIEIVSQDKNAYQTALKKEVTQKMANLLQTLPQMQRNALHMYYYDELTVDEISDKLEKTEQSVRSLLKRGKASLKEKMQYDKTLSSSDIDSQALNILR
jgi:RNA polymerase sigma-70 factor (ECF subfamily)